MELLSIRQAASAGIDKVRKPIWSSPMDHIKIDVIRGEPGPWTHLYCPFNIECNGHDPVDMLFTQVDYDAVEFVQYSGPLPESDEYRAAVARLTRTTSTAPAS